MILSHQQRERLKPSPAQVFATATIAEISGNRARLTFPDGQTSQKYYRLMGAGYAAGQRVQIRKEAGTYIIEGVI